MNHGAYRRAALPWGMPAACWPPGPLITTMLPRGWHSRGYLPHFDSAETIQFVTFRLADSLPRAVVEALRTREDAIQLIHEKLDSGAGARWLRRLGTHHRLC